MVKDDAIYQVLLKHDFDLFRGDKGIADYLADHLSGYYRDIVTAIGGSNPFLGEDFIHLLSAEIGKLKTACDEIPIILRAFDDGHIFDAYSKSHHLFDDLKPYLLSRYSWNENAGDFYRIRSGDFRIKDTAESKKKKAELFHIKKSLRNRIKAYRYSVAGYPCLYLASDRQLAWFECGMPKQFSYCHMAITENGENALRLVDFSWRPVDLLSSITIWILNARRQDVDDLEQIYNRLVKYIITYPIAAACSVKVKNRGSSFVEEYIFPQLFMHWIRESDDFDGVRYKSSLNSTLVRGMGAVNVALPIKKFREDGLDDRLTAKIGISDIGYLDVTDDFKRYKTALDEIRMFKDGLRVFIIELQYVGDYVIELIDMCECVIKTYTALMEGDYSNSELIFTYLDRLYEHADLIYKCREIRIKEYMEKARPEWHENIDIDIIKSHFEQFRVVMSKILEKNTTFLFAFENLGNDEYL